jgi:hypothetical protein
LNDGQHALAKKHKSTLLILLYYVRVITTIRNKPYFPASETLMVSSAKCFFHYYRPFALSEIAFRIMLVAREQSADNIKFEMQAMLCVSAMWHFLSIFKNIFMISAAMGLHAKLFCCLTNYKGSRSNRKGYKFY